MRACRRAINRGLEILVGSALVSCTVVLGWILYTLVWRGAPAISWDFLSRPPAEAGAAGGIVYQIFGTCLLIVSALVMALPVALGLALTRSVYLGPAAARRLGFALYVLSGVPSVLFGILGLLVFVQWLGWGKSWLAGGILLAAMIIPTIAVALAERFDAIPRATLEAARGLGLTRGQLVRAVFLPQSLGSLLSGSLLGLARAAGETAPILFAATVFSGATVPHGIVDSPVLALPVHIFTLAQDALGEGAARNLWASAAVLVGLVAALSLVALPARLTAHDEALHV